PSPRTCNSEPARAPRLAWPNRSPMEGLVARSEKIGPTKGVSAPISSYHPAGGSVATQRITGGREYPARSPRLRLADGGDVARARAGTPARAHPCGGGPIGTATGGRLRSRVEEQVARRGPGRRHLGRQAEVGENLPDDDRVLDGRDHSRPAATARVGEDIHGEGLSFIVHLSQ